uniref:PHD-type domain-containing protein n=2 Tax=Ciona intestinalis TaxID=7719 RepID=H2XJT4_CIOIN
MENECVVVEPEGLPKDKFIGPEFSTYICSQTGSKKRTVNRGSSNHAAGTTEPSILDKVIRCTGCGEQILTHLSSNANEHPVLHVLLCKRCYSYYHSGTFQKDENGIDEFCRWCGDGGDVIMCDSCTNVFCKTCIRRNFSRKKANEIFTSDTVQCFVCDLTPLQSLIQECKEVLEAFNTNRAPVVVKKKHRRAAIEENKSNGVIPSPETTTTIKKIDHPVVGRHKTTDTVNISNIRSECMTIVDDTCSKVGELHSLFKQVFSNDTEDQRKVALTKLRTINQIKSKLNDLVGLSSDFYESVCKEEKQLQARISHESTDDSMTTSKETDDLDSTNTNLSTPSRKKKLLKRKFRENILRNSNSPAGKTWRKLHMDESQEDKSNNEASDKELSKYIPIKLKLDDQCSDKQALGGVSVSDIFHEEASDSDCSGLFKPRKIKRQSSNKSDSQKKESPVEKKIKKGGKNDKEAEDQSPGAKTTSSDLDELIPKKKKKEKEASDSENSDPESLEKPS